MNNNKSPGTSRTEAADARVSASKSLYTRELDDVISAETERIRVRRGAANVKVTESGVPDGPVGVSLSGGGVRSGATSLGFLMGLSERGLLRWIDYLSTVSGGGYAGAVLTAEAAAQAKAAALGDAGADADRMRFFPPHQKAGEANTRAPNLARLRELVAHSNYLIQNQGWLSRAALGVVLMGTVVFSTLTTVMAFLAILFRSLYTPACLDMLRALGFEGDLIVPMTPALGFFLVWLVCWAMSFLRNRRHATGQTASVVFRLFLLCTILGITMIAVTGDIEAEKLLLKTGTSAEAWKEWEFLGGWFKSAVVALIGASLLPYFSPGALLRSGKERVAGPRKFLFVLARNGLLFGLPLVIFGMFARENISTWQDIRDNRLEFKDLLAEEGDQEFGPSLKLTNALKTWTRGTSDKGRLQAQIRNLIWSAPLQQEWDYFHRCDREYRLLNAGWSTPQEQSETSLLDSVNEMTRVSRFFSLVAFLADGASTGPESTPFGRMLYWLGEQRCSQRRLMFMINSRLLDPQIFEAVRNELLKIDGGPTSESVVKGLVTSESERDKSATYLSGVRAAANAGRTFYGIQAPETDSEAIDDREATVVRPENAQLLAENIASSLAIFLSERQKFLAKMMQIHQQGDNEPLEDEQSGVTREEIAVLKAIHDLPASMQPLFQGFKEFPNEESTSRADYEAVLSSILKINHQILWAVFPDTLRPRTAEAEIFSTVVHTKDQQVRWSIFWTALGTALVTSLLFDLNSTSWHGFYAAQLSRFWVRAGYENHNELRMDEIHDAHTAAPYHLINAAVSFPGQAPGYGGNSGENPDHFLLSQLYCGSDQHGLGFTDTTNSFFSGLTLGDAIALSGAAVSPWATNNTLVRALLLVMNLRTGLWLPRPQPPTQSLPQGIFGKIAQRFFTPLQWGWMSTMPDVTNGFSRRPPTEWSHLLVTDGGHYENLGIEALLRRRCRLIVAVDATEDADYEFEGLAIALNRARSRWGIEFLDCVEDQPVAFPGDLVPDTSTGFGKDRFWAVRIRYPSQKGREASEGLLIYVKSVILADDPLPLFQRKKVSAAFPNDPTSDQFFDPELFEAYRFLGFTAAMQLADRLKVSVRGDCEDLVQRCQETFVDTPQKKTVVRKSRAAVHGCIDDLISGINAYCAEDSQPDGRDPLPDIRERLEFLAQQSDLNRQLGHSTVSDRAGCLDALKQFLLKVGDPAIQQLALGLQRRLIGESTGAPSSEDSADREASKASAKQRTNAKKKPKAPV